MRTPEEKENIKRGLEKYIEEHRVVGEMLTNVSGILFDAADILEKYEKSFTYHGVAETIGKLQVSICYVDRESSTARKMLEKIKGEENENV